MKFKKGDLVATWLSDKVGKVIKYDPVEKKVTVKTKGINNGYNICNTKKIKL